MFTFRCVLLAIFKQSQQPPNETKNTQCFPHCFEFPTFPRVAFLLFTSSFLCFLV